MTTLSIPIKSGQATSDALAATIGGKADGETPKAHMERVLTAYAERITREHQAEAVAAAVRAAVLSGTDPVAAVAAAVGARTR